MTYSYDTIEPSLVSDYEIERGKPMPNLVHSFIQSRLVFLLTKFYGQHYYFLSELTFETPEKDSTPDISICEKKPIDLFDNRAKETTPPFGAVEIISPSQGFGEMKTKADRYFAFGVRSCWIINPSVRTIYVFSSPQEYEVFAKDDLLTDPQLGITLSLSEIFNV